MKTKTKSPSFLSLLQNQKTNNMSKGTVLNEAELTFSFAIFESLKGKN